MQSVKNKALSVASAVAVSLACAFSFAACAYNNPDEPAKHRDAPNAITKKGVCVSRYNDGKASSAQKVADLNPAWYYTWGVKTKNEYINAEFVPMVWGSWQVTQENLNYIKTNYESGKFTHLLTFNEPDLPDQANLTVEEALSYWEQLEEIGIPLSSPVVSWYDNGHPWLDEFMEKAEARGLRVDFIAVHSYQPFYLPNQAQTLKTNTLDVLYEKYHKPIWLTEFGAIDVIARDIGSDKLMDGCTEESAQKYIKETTDMLEQCGYVERYSWFLDNLSERGAARPFEAVYTSLFNDDDTLAKVGETYRAVQSNVALILENEDLSSATVGKKYKQQLFACGGTGGYTFTASGLPAGLSLSRSGKLSGKPEEGGVYNVTITVTDAGAAGRTQTVTRTYTLTVSG